MAASKQATQAVQAEQPTADELEYRLVSDFCQDTNMFDVGIRSLLKPPSLTVNSKGITSLCSDAIQADLDDLFENGGDGLPRTRECLQVLTDERYAKEVAQLSAEDFASIYRSLMDNQDFFNYSDRDGIRPQLAAFFELIVERWGPDQQSALLERADPEDRAAIARLWNATNIFFNAQA